MSNALLIWLQHHLLFSSRMGLCLCSQLLRCCMAIGGVAQPSSPPVSATYKCLLKVLYGFCCKPSVFSKILTTCQHLCKADTVFQLVCNIKPPRPHQEVQKKRGSSGVEVKPHESMRWKLTPLLLELHWVHWGQHDCISTLFDLKIHLNSCLHNVVFRTCDNVMLKLMDESTEAETLLSRQCTGSEVAFCQRHWQAGSPEIVGDRERDVKTLLFNFNSSSEYWFGKLVFIYLFINLFIYLLSDLFI